MLHHLPRTAPPSTAAALTWPWLWLWLALTLCICPARADPGADYRIGAGDTLKVTVLENPELGAEVRVRQNGEVRLPLLENVPLGGLTLEQAEDLVRSRLKVGNFVREPHVLVMVSAFRSRQVSVLGAVTRPGLYQLEGSARVSELLAMAGGLQPLAADTVIVQRGAPEQRLRLVLDLNQALIDGRTDQDPPVQAGDLLFVPKAPVFYIYGEVLRPGTYRFDTGLTMQQALVLGGGATVRGNLRSLRVSRRDAQQHMQTNESVGLDELLRADDILFVKERLF